MSQTTERQLDLIINLLENLPKKIVDEISKKNHLINPNEDLKNDIEFYINNLKEINELIHNQPV